ncbi:GGDEF domain-containing protein [Rubrivivax gelatinosus]|uniref:diguanylate cyclase n=1 Tax=Rubrivivax gelatinosus (strain NBRC 100245 / IL144) TaxID=983917 RepID=I0HSX2_RUBGI|nr:GGDEF domain-containing protein [Rubrivivax gelatinosus]BAL96109.1 diguanylate cyclase [Rubrivivax gelatinosus IL144]
MPGRSSHDFLRAGWLVRAGDDAAAAPLLQALVDEARGMPPGLMAEGWLLHGELLRRRGEDGTRSAARALELAERFADDGAVWLRRRARAEDLAGRPDAALPLLLRCHARQMASVRAALDARVDELAARLVDLHLRDENRQLRAHNQGLQDDVRQYSRLAETDALTGLPNRRALEAEFEARRGPGPLVLAVLDLDHFKRINDRFSHLVGDAVLRQAGALMAASLRAPDLLARLGGEEFVALAALPPDEAAGAFERVRRSLAEHAWGEIAEGLQVTVSIGVTAVSAGEDLIAALARADALLYRAKHEGRDRVVHDAG